MADQGYVTVFTRIASKFMIIRVTPLAAVNRERFEWSDAKREFEKTNNDLFWKINHA